MDQEIDGEALRSSHRERPQATGRHAAARIAVLNPAERPASIASLQRELIPALHACPGMRRPAQSASDEDDATLAMEDGERLTDSTEEI